MKHRRLVAATGLLAAGAIVLSGCDVPHTSMAYASEVVNLRRQVGDIGQRLDRASQRDETVRQCLRQVLPRAHA